MYIFMYRFAIGAGIFGNIFKNGFTSKHPFDTSFDLLDSVRTFIYLEIFFLNHHDLTRCLQEHRFAYSMNSCRTSQSEYKGYVSSRYFLISSSFVSTAILT